LIDIIPASVEGRVDTLFICQGKDQYGRYDQEKREVIVDEDPGKLYRASLYNMAAVNTLRNGGWVYLSAPGDMPLKNTNMNALMRY
jgi:hypothetical protein